jgi:hypothetical protein
MLPGNFTRARQTPCFRPGKHTLPIDYDIKDTIGARYQLGLNLVRSQQFFRQTGGDFFKFSGYTIIYFNLHYTPRLLSILDNKKARAINPGLLMCRCVIVLTGGILRFGDT